MSKILNCVIFQIFFFIIFSQKCIENQNFCYKCDKSNSLCLKCEYDILVPDENGGCIGSKKCIKGENYCDECNEENNLCKTCEIGYIPDENGGCSYINNCEISYNGECIHCKNDFILIGNKDNLKMCKYLYSDDLKNCKSIDKSNGKCEICEDGYYLSRGDQKCTQTENCFETKYGKCLTCDIGYYLYKKEEKCLLQEDKFYRCKETLDGENCDKCENNFYFDEEGKCVSTNFCKKSENFICVECISNYYLTQNGEGCSIDENCFSSDKEFGDCIWCKPNYYLRFSDKKCMSNSENNEYKFCRTVTDKCILCESGYFLSEDNKCTITKNCLEADNGICVQCSEGNYLGKDNKCSKYEHCIYSNFHYDCLECEDGYLWNILEQRCQEWGEDYLGCKILDVDNITCSICKEDFYLNQTDHKCYDNIENDNYYKCLIVTNNLCMKCSSNYYLGNDHKCTKIDNCQLSIDENNCEKCQKNYCLDKSKKICKYNAGINEEEDKKYFRCSKLNEDGTFCIQCEDGLILNEENLCINEKLCSEKEDNKCISCINNKSSWKNSCLNEIFGCVETMVENCYRCDNIFDFNNCTKCSEGYILNNEGECI